VFGRRVSRQSPGRFHTKIINSGVKAAIQVHYRASTVKQYFKEGRALRTETTVNDTHDCGIGRRLTDQNWNALIGIGHQINQRLLGHRLDACQCAPDATTVERVVLLSNENGLPTPDRGSASRARARCSPACAPISTCSLGRRTAHCAS
jgi:hypothetical protein